MKLSEREIVLFQKKILTWYTKNKRALPWRESRDPYRILVSEVMLQQTQVSRVIPKFNAWFKKFPTIHELANAKISDVLLYWSGLGYNRRALNLKKTAEIISRDYQGTFPQDEKLLRTLPGIGQYTARALLCFAFDKQVAVVDTNVRKILITQFGFNGGEKELLAVAEQLLPKNRAYDWNQALMDYAGSVLKKEKIAIPKQSKFVGSHRYYRGQVVKTLLKNKTVRVSKLGAILKKDYSSRDDIWLRDLLKELIDEGFIKQENDLITL